MVRQELAVGVPIAWSRRSSQYVVKQMRLEDAVNCNWRSSTFRYTLLFQRLQEKLEAPGSRSVYRSPTLRFSFVSPPSNATASWDDELSCTAERMANRSQCTCRAWMALGYRHRLFNSTICRLCLNYGGLRFSQTIDPAF